jgi:hypothetical protein
MCCIKNDRMISSTAPEFFLNDIFLVLSCRRSCGNRSDRWHRQGDGLRVGSQRAEHRPHLQVTGEVGCFRGRAQSQVSQSGGVTFLTAPFGSRTRSYMSVRLCVCVSVCVSVFVCQVRVLAIDYGSFNEAARKTVAGNLTLPHPTLPCTSP